VVRPSLAPVVVAIAMVGVACTSSSPEPAPTGATPAGETLNAEVASADLVAGDPQRFLVGMFSRSGHLLSFGDVDLRFSFLGTADEPTPAAPGPSATATFVPAPGTARGAGEPPTLTTPSQGRGVYQAVVTFDRPGIWRVAVAAGTGEGSLTASASFEVLRAPQLPYPGDGAPSTENLTIRSNDAPPEAIDSRAAGGGAIPDPDLHRWTIAAALKQRLPVLATFATPVYCLSRFCGPTVEEVERLHRRYRDRAVFIHVEIWRDFEGRVINEAAAEWLYRGGDLTEPWTFLIGPDGRILDRWGSLFDPREVAAALDKLPSSGRSLG
jgi:hypothetical protein